MATTELGILDCLCEVLNRNTEVAMRLDERCRYGVRDEVRIATLRARLNRGMKEANDLFAQLPRPAELRQVPTPANVVGFLEAMRPEGAVR